MKGKFFYFGIAAILGLLTVFLNKFIFVILMILILFFTKKQKRFSNKQLGYILLFFLFFMARGEMYEQRNKTHISESGKDFLIYFHEQININGDLFSAIGTAVEYKEKIAIKYLLRSKEEKEYIKENFIPGTLCYVNGNLETPNKATNINAFNYKTYLYQKEVHWILQLNNVYPQSCKSNQTPSLSTFLEIYRQKGIKYIESNFPKETASFASALIFGDRNLIETEIIESYQELGIVHILAISGSHVCIVVSIFYFLFLRLGLTKETTITLLIILLPIYAFLAGGTPSVNRGVLLTLLILCVIKFGNKSNIIHIDLFILVFILYIGYSPNVIFDIGFQLSFGICAALILSASIIQKVPHYIGKIFVTSIISQLSSAPILLYHFFELSIISLFANIIFVPLYTVILLPSCIFLYLLHLILGPYVNPLLEILNIIIQLSNKIALKMSDLPLSTIILGRPNLSLIILYIVMFPLFFVKLEKEKNTYKQIKLFFLPVFLFIFQILVTNYSPTGEVNIIDVGQGDSIFIRQPFGKGNYLIDTGGTIQFEKQEWQKRKEAFEVGRDVVVPYLKSKGISTIDKLILTHGDLDHIGGTLAVLKELKVKEIILPLISKQSVLEEQVILHAKEKNIPIKWIRSGEGWKSGDSTFFALSPIDQTILDKNDSSIVLYTKLGGLRWLFTGDLSEEGEKRILQKYPKMKIDVLKVGHHGSKTSTSEIFLDHIQPEYALISVGKNNRYGHPNQAVLNYLTERNITILRTDKNGGITYKFRKKAGTFTVQLP